MSASVSAQKTDHQALDLDIRGGRQDHRHSRVRGLQSNCGGVVTVDSFECHLSRNQRDHHFTVRCSLRPLDNHKIAVVHPVLDHRFAPDHQNVMVARAEELGWDRFPLVIGEGLDRRTGSDRAEQGQVDGAGRSVFGRGQDETAFLVLAALEKALSFEVGNVFLSAGRASEAKGIGNLLQSRRDTVGLRFDSR